MHTGSQKDVVTKRHPGVTPRIFVDRRVFAFSALGVYGSQEARAIRGDAGLKRLGLLVS